MEIYGNIIMLIMLAICSVMDIVKRHLHIFLLIIFGVFGVVFQATSIYQMIAAGKGLDYKSLAFGICLGLVIILISIASRESLGMGDAILILDCALFLGFWGVLSLLWMSCLFAGMTSFVLIYICKKSKNYRIPFVPFIFFSYVFLIVIAEYGGFT